MSNLELSYEQSTEFVNFVFLSIVSNQSLKDDASIYKIGVALWDIFSNNHSVVNECGYELYIGSWRGSGRTISDILNIWSGTEKFGYLDFYMGSDLHVESKTILNDYKEIIGILKKNNCDWKYSIPSTYLFNFDGQIDDTGLNRSDSLNDIKKVIDKINLEKEKEVFEEIPYVIRAYHEVFKKLPEGYNF